MSLIKSESRKTMARTAALDVRVERRLGKVKVSVVVGLLMLTMGVVIGSWINRIPTEVTSNTPTAARNTRDYDVKRIAGQQAVPSSVDESNSGVSEPVSKSGWDAFETVTDDGLDPSEVTSGTENAQDATDATQPQAIQPVHYNTEVKATFAETRKPKVQPVTAEELFAKSSACVVRVNIRNAQNKVAGHGSGFFIRDDSTVVTNFHVIDGANSAEDGRGRLYLSGKHSKSFGSPENGIDSRATCFCLPTSASTSARPNLPLRSFRPANEFSGIIESSISSVR